MIFLDIFNSKKFLSYGFKKPLYSNNKVEIFEKLDDVYDYFNNLKFEDGSLIVKSARRLGLAGFLINIQTLKWLYVNYIEKGILSFLPLYKLSQDHLEKFFSAIRSRGGFNNNPTARNFISSYKRLLCHTEVRISDSGNCVPLDNITILSGATSTVDRINTSLKYNKITKEFELKNEEQDEESLSLILNKLPNNIEDLKMFVKSVVHHIAGFVVKKNKKHVHCEECIQSLLQSRSNYMSSLISKKDFLLYGEGFLVFPSNDVIFVCEQSEHYFRRFIKTNFNFNKRLTKQF